MKEIIGPICMMIMMWIGTNYTVNKKISLHKLYIVLFIVIVVLMIIGSIARWKVFKC